SPRRRHRRSSMRRGTCARECPSRGCRRRKRPSRRDRRARLFYDGGALADLLRLLVPLDALADARTQLPLRRLRLRVDPLAQVVEARDHDRLVMRLEIEAWNRGAGALGVERGSSPETPVARAALGDVSGVDPVGVRLRELVSVD